MGDIRPLTRWLLRRNNGSVYANFDDGKNIIEVGPILPEDAIHFGLAMIQVATKDGEFKAQLWGDAGMSTT